MVSLASTRRRAMILRMLSCGTNSKLPGSNRALTFSSEGGATLGIADGAAAAAGASPLPDFAASTSRAGLRLLPLVARLCRRHLLPAALEDRSAPAARLGLLPLPAGERAGVRGSRRLFSPGVAQLALPAPALSRLAQARSPSRRPPPLR